MVRPHRESCPCRTVCPKQPELARVSLRFGCHKYRRDCGKRHRAKTYGAYQRQCSYGLQHLIPRPGAPQRPVSITHSLGVGPRET